MCYLLRVVPLFERVQKNLLKQKLFTSCTKLWECGAQKVES